MMTASECNDVSYRCCLAFLWALLLLVQPCQGRSSTGGSSSSSTNNQYEDIRKSTWYWCSNIGSLLSFDDSIQWGTLQVTKELLSTGEPQFVNSDTYCFTVVENLEDGPIVYTVWNYVLWLLSIVLITWIFLSLAVIHCLVSRRAAKKIVAEHEWKARSIARLMMSRPKQKKRPGGVVSAGGGGLTVRGGVQRVKTANGSKKMISVAQAFKRSNGSSHGGHNNLSLSLSNDGIWLTPVIIWLAFSI